MEKKFYTLIVYSENLAGLLNQVTIAFTRRSVNIESLNVAASSTPGVHKYTITCWSTKDLMEKITLQLEKRIDILQANYFEDNEVYIQETALFKLSTPVVLAQPEISAVIRRHGATIVEVNPTYSVVTMHGLTDEIFSLRDNLKKFDCILQYSRSGRIVITKECTERLNEYLHKREELYRLEKEGEEPGK